MQIPGLKFMIDMFRKNNPAVAIEIGNDWLKILEFTVGPANAITNASFIKLAQIKEPIADAISKIFRELKLKKKNIITYIPRNLVTIRILELPSTDPKEITEMINLQIGKQTPYSKEEITFSYRIIDTDREGYAKVMLAIVRHNIISERLAALQKIGIEPTKVTLSSEGVYDFFCTVNSAELKNKAIKTIILLDIDSNYSDFIVLHKERLSFTKNILIGANNLLAEPKLIEEKFIEELKHSIDVYYEEEKGTKIEKLFLSGAAKNITNLAKTLSAHLDIPVETMDIFKNIKIAEKTGSILKSENNKFISLTPLLGVWLKSKELAFDLMPEGVRIKKLVEEKKNYLTITGILAIAIVAMLSLLVLLSIYNKNVYLAQLTERISNLKDNSEKIESMRQLVSLTEERLDARGDSLTILNELYDFIPKEIYLTSIAIEKRKQLTVKGRALAMSDVFKFIAALEKSHYFKNVKNTYTTTKKEDNYEFADFEIVCIYEEKTDNR